VEAARSSASASGASATAASRSATTRSASSSAARASAGNAAASAAVIAGPVPAIIARIRALRSRDVARTAWTPSSEATWRAASSRQPGSP
jgi:hypothetical protein